MVSRGDIGLDSIGFMKRFFKQRGSDRRSVDGLTRQSEARICNDVQNGGFVLIRRSAVGGIHVVDQTLVQRPSIHLAFPVINNGIAEAIDFRLLVRHPGGEPSGLRSFHRPRRRVRQQIFNSRMETQGCGKAVAENRLGNIRVVFEHGLFAHMSIRNGRISETESESARGNGQFLHEWFSFFSEVWSGCRSARRL